MVGGRRFGERVLRLYLPLGFFLVAMLFPFYWMAITSIKPNRELYSAKIMPLIVHQPTLQHYVDLLEQTNFLTWTYNTILVAVVTTVVSLVLGAMIAYPLARLNFPGAAVVAIGVAATYLVPQPLPGDAARGPAALHPGPALGGDLRLHAGAERVPVRADLPDQERRAHGAGGGDHGADPRRRLLLGPAHGRRPAGLHTRRVDLLVLRGLLRGRPHRRLRQELAATSSPAGARGDSAGSAAQSNSAPAAWASMARRGGLRHAPSRSADPPRTAPAPAGGAGCAAATFTLGVTRI